jgi:Mn-dependent DtxR family transcriptional regulator
MELGVRGAGGEFDTHVMSELMTLGFVEVESTSRSVVLTPAGRQIYAELLAKHAG